MSNYVLIQCGTFDLTPYIQADGYNRTQEDLYSSTTGRDPNTGDMYAKLINHKWHITINTMPLSEKDTAKILIVIRGENGKMPLQVYTFTDPYNPDKTLTKKMRHQGKVSIDTTLVARTASDPIHKPMRIYLVED